MLREDHTLIQIILQLPENKLSGEQPEIHNYASHSNGYPHHAHEQATEKYFHHHIKEAITSRLPVETILLMTPQNTGPQISTYHWPNVKLTQT